MTGCDDCLRALDAAPLTAIDATGV